MTNKEAKQQAIRKAYGEYYDKCEPDENGWTSLLIKGWNVVEKIQEYYPFFNEDEWEYEDNDPFFKSAMVMFRPKSLSGIESNNGWHRIDGPEDLPKVAGDYRFKRLDNKRNEVAYYIAHPDGDKWFALFYTHWRPVEEVPEPVY